MDNVSSEHIDIYTIRFLFGRYKSYLIPFLVILTVIILFIKITLPAIQDLIEGYEKQNETKLSIENIRQNINFIRNVDNSQLDSQFNIVTKALPIDKDFHSVLNAISDSSNKSAVALGGFKIKVGDLSNDELENEYPSLELELNLNGNTAAVNRFIGVLALALPLSEITKISTQKDLSKISIVFYYNFLKPTISRESKDSLPLRPISDSGLLLIEELTNLYIPQVPNIDLTTSTPSANPFF